MKTIYHRKEKIIKNKHQVSDGWVFFARQFHHVFTAGKSRGCFSVSFLLFLAITCVFVWGLIEVFTDRFSPSKVGLIGIPKTVEGRILDTYGLSIGFDVLEPRRSSDGKETSRLHITHIMFFTSEPKTNICAEKIFVKLYRGDNADYDIFRDPERQNANVVLKGACNINETGRMEPRYFVIDKGILGDNINLKYTNFFHIEETAIIQNINTDITLEFEEYPDNLKEFPFDERIISIYFWVEAIRNGTERITIAPSYEGRINRNEWSWDAVKMEGRNFRIGEDPFPHSLLILDYTRPLYLRIFIIIIVATLIAFITMLFLIKNSVQAVEVSLVLVFGLWGIQSVIYPNLAPETIGIPSIILFLYFYMAWVTVTRFIILPTFTRNNIRVIPENWFTEKE